MLVWVLSRPCSQEEVPKQVKHLICKSSFQNQTMRTCSKPNLEGGFGLNLWKGFVLFQAKLGPINLGGGFGLNLWKKDFFRRSLGRYTRHGCLGSPWCGSTAQVSCWSLMFWSLQILVFFNGTVKCTAGAFNRQQDYLCHCICKGLFCENFKKCPCAPIVFILRDMCTVQETSGLCWARRARCRYCPAWTPSLSWDRRTITGTYSTKAQGWFLRYSIHRWEVILILWHQGETWYKFRQAVQKDMMCPSGTLRYINDIEDIALDLTEVMIF